MMKKILRCLLVLLACFMMQAAHAQCFLDNLATDLLDAGTSQNFKDFLKRNPEGMRAYKRVANSPQLRKDVDVLESISNFQANQVGYLQKNSANFDNIITRLKEAGVRCKTCASGSNKGIPMMHEVIDDMDWTMTAFKDKDVNLQAMFNEMGASGNKADGAAFALNTIRKNAAADANYVENVSKFEYKYLDDGSFEADLYRQVGNTEYLTEFKSFNSKSWLTFSSDTKKVAQFKAYISSGKKVEYFANASKLTDQGADATKYVKEQFLKIFRNDANAEAIFKSNPLYFKDIRYKGAEIDIDSYQQLINYAKDDDFLSSSLFNFVKLVNVTQ